VRLEELHKQNKNPKNKPKSYQQSLQKEATAKAARNAITPTSAAGVNVAVSVAVGVGGTVTLAPEQGKRLAVSDLVGRRCPNASPVL